MTIETNNGAEPAGYEEFIADLKQRVRTTQFRAMRAANTEVMRLYWSVGRDILDRQKNEGWGAKVVDQISADMRREFVGQRGWSTRSLKYMRKLADAWPVETEFVQQAAAQLPGKQIAERDREQALMDRIQDTLLELGRGMAFVGRQYRIEVGGDEFFVDLLFFHVTQLRYVVVELKVGKFQPAHIGQIGTYVAMVDGEIRKPDLHAQTVGIPALHRTQRRHSRLRARKHRIPRRSSSLRGPDAGGARRAPQSWRTRDCHRRGDPGPGVAHRGAPSGGWYALTVGARWAELRSAQPRMCGVC
jgi:predicted nuclease of restriction endonuclease-like (RecB) superfamily